MLRIFSPAPFAIAVALGPCSGAAFEFFEFEFEYEGVAVTVDYDRLGRTNSCRPTKAGLDPYLIPICQVRVLVEEDLRWIPQGLDALRESVPGRLQPTATELDR